MSFNAEDQKTKMKPAVDKLVSYLNTKGIEFFPTDGDLKNVVLKSNDKEVKISHHSFYRHSSIACVYKENSEKNTIDIIDVTDEMFMNNFMKPIINLHFGIK